MIARPATANEGISDLVANTLVKRNDPASPNESPNSGEEWFAKLMIEKIHESYRAVWELYIKFDTVFITANFIAFAAYDPINNGAFLAWAFVLQNLVTAITSFCLAIYSHRTSKRYSEACNTIVQMFPINKPLNGIAECPIPGWLGVYSGAANVIAHLVLATFWFALT